MSKWIVVTAALIFGAAFMATDADAKRLGGGRTVGAQRSVTPPPAQQGSAPAGAQAAPAQKAPQAAPAAAPAGNRWAGILGGLALGGLLGYFFGGNGLMGVLLLAGLAAVAVLLVRAFLQPRAAFAGAQTGASIPMNASTEAPMTAAARFPAGFDADGFLRSAKVNYVKLQLANDRGDLEEIREFTTPELFGTLQEDFRARAGRQETDISSLEARLLDVATEDGRHWASIGFSGLEREAPGAPATPFSEVWNLVKPVDGSSGWLLAGIQQMH